VFAWFIRAPKIFAFVVSLLPERDIANGIATPNQSNRNPEEVFNFGLSGAANICESGQCEIESFQEERK
jgi:hypothetical protein